MRRIGILFIVLCSILAASFIVSAGNDAKADREVYSALDKQEKAKVIISLNENSEEFGVLGKITEVFSENALEKIKGKKSTFKFSSGEYATEITKSELESLIKEEKIRYIEPVREFKILLQNSTNIINATRTWPMQVSQLNLTGIGQTVCIIDTGINYSHADLIGRNLTSCNIDCVNNDARCFENCSENDFNGHGTHVAGIAAASGGISGIAKGANFIALKVFPGTGKTGATTIGIKNAIDWCVNNASLFNISVITMSLGSDTLYNSYCDEFSPSLSGSINSASAKNISVTAATGNDGNSSAVSLPACIQNATPVSSTDKNDAISSFSDRNSIVKLMAPGGASSGTGSCSASSTDENRICSAYNNGAYISMSGTSMAAPHVAGAIAVIREFLLLTGQTKTPKEIEAILNNTGKRIADSASGLNFSRINLYSAIISLDNISPNVSLISPANNAVSTSKNQTFRCNGTDLSLKNATFYLWNSSSLWNSSFSAVSGSYAVLEINISNMPYGSYKWNCLFYDENNNHFQSGNFSLTIGGVSTMLISPSNNNHTNQNQANFTCQSQSDISYSLTNTTFYLWNSTNLEYNETRSISGVLNSSVFNYTFLSEGRYNWTCASWNNASNYSLAGNYSIVYDILSPVVSLNLPDNSASYTSSSQEINFIFNASDSYDFGFCSLIINNAVSLANSSINNNENTSITQSFSPGNYTWQINCTDLAGNSGNSSSREFIISSPPAQAYSPSGGGGGGAAIGPKVYTPSKEQITAGYSQELNKNDKIRFTIFDEKNQQHELTIENITENSVLIMLESEIVIIRLGIGQSIKLNMTSPDYYDLFIKLESIEKGKAKLTIQTIHDLIIREITGKRNENAVESGGGKISIEKENLGTSYVYIGFIALILAILISGYILFKRFRKSFKIKFEIKHNKHWRNKI